MQALALGLLSAAAEQANSLQRKSRADLLAVLPQQADHVFAFIYSVLTDSQGEREGLVDSPVRYHMFGNWNLNLHVGHNYCLEKGQSLAQI